MNRTFLLNSFLAISLFIAFSFTLNPGGLTDDVLKYANQFRQSKRLPSLVMKQELNEIAEEHSRNMARGRVGFGHGGFNKRFEQARKKIVDFNTFAENVAYGVNSGKEVIDLWKKSPGHRKNLLGTYRYTGIGIATDKNNRVYYTQVFVN